VFGKTNDNCLPDYVCVWKVPSSHPPEHAAKAATAICQCRQAIPKHVGKETTAPFDLIISGLSNLNRSGRKALYEYIFCGVGITDDHNSEDEYLKLVMDMTVGEPIQNVISLG